MIAALANKKSFARRSALLMGILATCFAPKLASAEVKHEGTWPAPSKDQIVSLDVSHMPREEAVKKLADAAGWSVAVNDLPPGDVGSIHVKNQPAGKVLDLILGDGDFVAKRDGDIVTVEGEKPVSGNSINIDLGPLGATINANGDPAAIPTVPPVAAIPTAPAALPAPSARGEDRTIAGGNLRIEKNEVVHDVTVLGGNVDILGTVTGDVSVMGGNVRMREGSHVMGDASTFGGTLSIEKGVDVDGDVSVIGGHLKRSDGCKIRGSVVTKGGSDDTEEDDDDDDDGKVAAHPATATHGDDSRAHTHKLHSFVSAVGESVTSAALLFVFGAVLLALTGKRMETLRIEAAARPMRSFAMGVVGFFASILIFIALCITIIGFPVAVVGLLLAVFAGYAGVCAVLSVAGQAVVRHKTANPYVHLAVGCAMFMVVSAIPFVGPIVIIIVAAMGIGVLVATRVGGLVPQRKRVNSGPYRTIPNDAPVDA